MATVLMMMGKRENDYCKNYEESTNAYSRKQNKNKIMFVVLEDSGLMVQIGMKYFCY